MSNWHGLEFSVLLTESNTRRPFSRWPTARFPSGPVCMVRSKWSSLNMSGGRGQGNQVILLSDNIHTMCYSLWLGCWTFSYLYIHVLWKKCANYTKMYDNRNDEFSNLEVWTCPGEGRIRARAGRCPQMNKFRNWSHGDPPRTDRQTWLKTLPSCNFVVG